MSLATNLAQIPNITVNRIPRATATGFVNSAIFDNGTNVGIGGTSPSGRLDVQASGTSAFIYYFRNSAGGYGGGIYNTGSNNTQLYLATSAGTENVVLSASGASYFNGGNVGIGKTNPSALLDISSTTTDTNIFLGSPTGYGSYIKLFNNSVAKWFIGTNATGAPDNDLAIYGYGGQNGNIIFYTNGSERMRITPTGTVGVGTTSPQARFDIVDSSQNQYTLRVQSSAGNNANAWGGIGFSGEGANTKAAILFVSDGGSYSRGSLVFAVNNDFNQNSATPSNARLRITSDGITYAYSSGVDGNYSPAIGTIYTGNNNETNVISTAVSSAASQSGFRFDVSNGAGTTGRTASMYINRTSVTVVGSLSKGSGSFKINHPLESMKDTHNLVHSFVESPQANNIYRGKVQLVNGKAQVNLDEVSTMTDGTFVALNRDIHAYTTNESDWDAVRGKVVGNILHIESENNESSAIVSWLVIGERQDKHMMDTDWTDNNGKVIVEPLKIQTH